MFSSHVAVKQFIARLTREWESSRELSKFPRVRELKTLKSLFESEVVFFVTPGRSGTKTIIKYLQNNASFLALHAPKPNLASISYLLNSGQLAAESAAWALFAVRQTYLTQAYERKVVFVDGDCKSLPILQFVSSIFPNSKFLHITRNPIDFVISGVRRGYYSEKTPELWGYLVKSESEGDMLGSGLRQIELIAEFWDQANLIAQKIQSSVGNGRFASIRAEDFFKNGEVIFDAFLSLGLDGHFLSVQKGPLGVTNSNENKNKSIDEDAILEVVRKCSGTASIYYPEIL